MKYWIIGYIIAVIVNYWLIKKYVRPKKWSWKSSDIVTWNDVIFTLFLSAIFPTAWLMILNFYCNYKKISIRIKVPKWLVLILLIGVSSCTESRCPNIHKYKGCVIVEKCSYIMDNRMFYGIRNSSDEVLEIDVYQDDFNKYKVGDTIK